MWGHREKGWVCSGAIALVVACLVFAGCGGSGSDPLTKAEFLKQGNAICATMQNERASQAKDAEAELADADEEETMSFALEPVETMTDELGDLGPPEGQEKEVEAIIAAFEDGTSQLEAEPTGPKSISAFAQADKKATAYGLTECTI
ncbi:MAG TPA: hypothetical protein VMS11_05945 [Solirubrobacterales bacterium]|nr:hypothetical protein [Solirubrobacterales bacterium]